MGKRKISIIVEYDFGQKVWLKAGQAGEYREGIVTGYVIGPAMDVLYQITWCDGTRDDHYDMELCVEQPKEWASHD